MRVGDLVRIENHKYLYENYNIGIIIRLAPGEWVRVAWVSSFDEAYEYTHGTSKMQWVQRELLEVINENR